MAPTSDLEVADIVRALDRAIRRGGSVEVRLDHGRRIRIHIEDDGARGTWLRALVSAVPPDTARRLERLGWTAAERRVWSDARHVEGRRAEHEVRRAEHEVRRAEHEVRRAEVVDDVRRDWIVAGATATLDAAADICDALEVIAGEWEPGTVVARHVPLGQEEREYAAIGCTVAGVVGVAATIGAAAVRLLAGYPLDLVGSLLVPAVVVVPAWFASTRAVLAAFSLARSLRPHAEATALVVGALAPALVIAGYTAAAIRLGLP